VLQTTKNIVTYGTAFPLITPTGRFQELRIGTWEYSRDSGFMPRGLLSYPSATSGTVLVGNLHPADCVAYGFDLDINDNTTYQPIQSSNKGQYMIREVLLAAPSASMTTGTAGIYQDNTGTSLVSSANNIALSPLTNTTTGSGNAMLMTLQSGETGKVRVGGQSLYWKTNAAQAKPSSFSSGSTTSSLSGRNGGNNNTNLGTINFGTAHAFVNGQTVDITGSAKTALNGRFKIVDTPDSNTIVIYVDSATAVASSADAGLTATLVPTLSAYLRGADIGAYNAH
jgi:hypothetical protein